MRIPEVQAELRKMVVRLSTIAVHYSDIELSAISTTLLELTIELSRRPAARRAPVKSQKITEELDEEIRLYTLAHPEMTYHEIGNVFKVGIGRPSEAINGKRT